MEEFIYQGRIAICKPNKVAKGTFIQHGFAGVLVALSGQELISNSDEWENIQCEIIIRPIKRLGVAKIKGMRLDQAAMSLSNDNDWVI